MSNYNWVKFIFAWDVQITKFFKSARLEDMYKYGNKPFCIQFNSFLVEALPNSNLWAGKIQTVKLSGQQILEILRYNVNEAVNAAHYAFTQLNNVALYEAIIFINSWSEVLSTQQAGLLSYDSVRRNKDYAKNFVIPEVIWISGRQVQHDWLNELGISQQSVYLKRDEIFNLYQRFDTTSIPF